MYVWKSKEKNPHDNRKRNRYNLFFMFGQQSSIYLIIDGHIIRAKYHLMKQSYKKLYHLKNPLFSLTLFEHRRAVEVFLSVLPTPQPTRFEIHFKIIIIIIIEGNIGTSII